jgi:hypothetical protein
MPTTAAKAIFGPDQLRSILDALDSETMQNANKRRSARIRLCAGISIKSCDDPALAAIDVMVEDLSTEGIGLVHVEPLRLGDSFSVLNPFSGSASDEDVRFKIVYCAPSDDGRYRIGGEFPADSGSPMQRLMPQ